MQYKTPGTNRHFIHNFLTNPVISFGHNFILPCFSPLLWAVLANQLESVSQTASLRWLHDLKPCWFVRSLLQPGCSPSQPQQFVYSLSFIKILPKYHLGGFHSGFIFPVHPQEKQKGGDLGDFCKGVDLHDYSRRRKEDRGRGRDTKATVGRQGEVN